MSIRHIFYSKVELITLVENIFCNTHHNFLFIPPERVVDLAFLLSCS